MEGKEIKKQAVRDFVRHLANHEDISNTDFYVLQSISDKYLEGMK